MEQTIAKRPFSRDQQINRRQTWHNGTVGSSGAKYQEDPSQSWYTRRQTGLNRPHIPSGTYGGDILTQDKGQRPECHDGLRFYGNENLGDVLSSKTPPFARGNAHSRTRHPCWKFQSGRCHLGATCPYLHSESTRYVKPRYDWSTQLQQGVPRTQKSHGFRKRNKGNTIEAPQGHYEINNVSPYLHPEHTVYVRPRYDWSTQHHHRAAATSFGKGSIGNSLMTSKEYGEENKDYDLRTKSLCRNFVSGKCLRGATCPYQHPVLYDRPMYDSSAQQHQGLAGTSSEPGFGQGNMDITHDKFKSHGMQLPQNTHAGSFVSFTNRNHGNMDITSRSLSSDRQRSRSLGGCGGDKPRLEVCLMFSRGRCNRGESCKYLHDFREFARSVPDWSKQPHLEATASLRNFGGSHQYVSSIACEAHDRSVEPKDLDQKGETLVMDQQECEFSGGVIASNCDFAEAHDDIRPFSSKSKRPFTPRDDFSRGSIRKDAFQNNLPRYRPHNNISKVPNAINPVAIEPDSRSSCEKNHISPMDTDVSVPNNDNNAEANIDLSKEGSEKTEALTIHPRKRRRKATNTVAIEPDSRSSCEKNHISPRDTDVSVPNNDNNAEVNIDLSKNGSEKTEALTIRPRKRRRKRHSKCRAEPMKEEVTDPAMQGLSSSSDGKSSLSHPGIVSFPNNDNNAEVNIDFSKEGSEKTEALTIHPRRRRKKTNSKCRAEPMKEEVTDPAMQGPSSSSAGKSSLSHPDIVSVAGVSDDMESASENNSVENVLTVDHPVQQLEQEMGAVANKIQNYINPAQAVIEDGTMLDGDSDSHSLQTSDSSLKPAILKSKRNLLILDLNGILADIVADFPDGYTPDTVVSRKAVFKRRFCNDFLEFCFERFDVGVWSSRTKKNVTTVVDFLMGNTKKRLLFCWDQSHCTGTKYKTVENSSKPLVLKELKKLWEKQVGNFPWKKGYYNETNTVLLDDSPYKALLNPPYTAIFPYSYTFEDAEDKSLGPGGDIRVYLERLATTNNVQKFIQENPFGQKPITESNLSWGFYSKVVKACEETKKWNAKKTCAASGKTKKGKAKKARAASYHPPRS